MYISSVAALLTILELSEAAHRVLVWPPAESVPARPGPERAFSAERPAGLVGAAEPVDWYATLETAPGEITRCEVIWVNQTASLSGPEALTFLQRQGPLEWHYQPLSGAPLRPARQPLPPAPTWKTAPRPHRSTPEDARLAKRGAPEEDDWVPQQTEQGRWAACAPGQLERDLRRLLLLIDGRRSVHELARLLCPRGEAREGLARIRPLLRTLHHVGLIH